MHKNYLIGWIHTSEMFLNDFVQSAVNACRQRDENHNSSTVATSMKLLANSSIGDQITDQDPHSLLNYMHDEKTHAVMNNKMLKRLRHITCQLYEVKFVQSEIEHFEQIIVGFLVLLFAKTKFSELCFKFLFFRFSCVAEKYKMKMETKSLY